MRLFGKTIGKTQKQKDDEFLRRESKKELERNRRLAREDLMRQQADAKRKRIELVESQRYQQEQQRLTRQGNIESARTRIARERAARAAAQERKYGGYRGTLESAASVLGFKSKRHNSGVRQRPVYVSTSHGLRKISADDPDYYKYREQQGQTAPPSVKRIVVKESSEDNEQPSAFSGW